MKSLHNVKRRTLVAILSIGLIGVLAMLWATRFGSGISPDSTVYLAAAQSLLRGTGFRVLSDGSGDLGPLTHYPPLYPALLSLAATSGASLPGVARWLNAILFGANIALVGVCVLLCARDSFWLPVFGSWITLTAVDIAGVHSFALTEPLFVFYVLLGILCLALYFEHQHRYFLIAAAVAMALSALTRYVGVVSLVTGGLVIFIGDNRRLSSLRNPLRRLWDAVLFGVIACSPSAIWAIRNRIETGSASQRQFVFHPVKLQQLAASISTMAQWLLLGKVPARLRAIVFFLEAAVLIAFGFYLWHLRRQSASGNNESAAPKLPLVLGIFIGVYLAVLIFTASFVEADMVFDNRSLVPVHVAGIVLVLCVGRKLYIESGATRSIGNVLVVLALLLTTSQSFRVVGWMIKTSRDGQGYASRLWTESQTIAAVRNLPPDISIYTNGQDAIYYLTGRPAISIPEKIIHGSGRPNEDYDSEVEKMNGDIRDHGAVLVYFHSFPERTYLPAEAELRRRLPSGISEYADGVIVSSGK